MDSPISTLKDLVLLILVIAVVGGIWYVGYTTILVPQTKSDFSAQSSSVQASVQSQANNFVSNLAVCAAKKSNSCICKNVVVNMPKEITVDINNKGTIPRPYVAINFLFNEKSFKSNNIENFSVSAAYNSGTEVKLYEFKGAEVYDTVFNFEKMEFNGQKVISNSVYKQGSKLYFIVYNSQFLGFIGKNEADQKLFFENLPVC